jgi:hypothetical protein
MMCTVGDSSLGMYAVGHAPHLVSCFTVHGWYLCIVDQLGRVDIISPNLHFLTNLPSGFATWLNVLFDVCVCRDQDGDQENLDQMLIKQSLKIYLSSLEFYQ